MKKILVIALCLVVLSFPISAYALEEETPAETTTTSTIVDTPVEDPAEDEETEEITPPNDTAPEGEQSPEGDTPVEDTPDEDAPVEDEAVGDTPSDEPVGDEGIPEDTPVDESTDTPVETPTDEPVDTPTEEPVDTPTDTPVDTPTTDTPTDTPTDVGTPVEEVKMTPTDILAKWLEDNADTISVIFSILGACIVIVKKASDLLKKAGIINDNAITIATESASQMKDAQEMINNAANVVTGYETKISELLEAFSKLCDENKLLKDDVNVLTNYLHTSTNANIEFANELAELLALANIPNYKKDEIGQRHLESVKAILDAYNMANIIMANHNPIEDTPVEEASVEEVAEDDGEEA